MCVIKRYSNRKLYDPEAKRYVTLKEIGGMVQEGKDVTVVDHASGVDLTALTLMQVIIEREKKIGGILPQKILTSMIQVGDRTISNLRSAILAFLDPVEHAETEIRRRLGILAEEGNLSEAEHHNMAELLLAPHLRRRDESEIGLDHQDAITLDELENLQLQVENLEKELEALQRTSQ